MSYDAVIKDTDRPITVPNSVMTSLEITGDSIVAASQQLGKILSPSITHDFDNNANTFSYSCDSGTNAIKLSSDPSDIYFESNHHANRYVSDS